MVSLVNSVRPIMNPTIPRMNVFILSRFIRAKVLSMVIIALIVVL